MLGLWHAWLTEGALSVGCVRVLGAAPPDDLQCLGVTLWITDAAVGTLEGAAQDSAAQRLYRSAVAARAAGRADEWVMNGEQIRQAPTHSSG